MLFLVEKYLEAHSDEGPEVDPTLVAQWVVTRPGLYKHKPQRPEEILKARISRALRDDYGIDPQGREVRKHHPVMTEIMTADGPRRHFTYHPLFTTRAETIRQSFQLRRRAAFADVSQLWLDFESYNDNNIFGDELEEPDFNFNKDLEELRLPTKYPDGLTDREYDEAEENDDDDF